MFSIGKRQVVWLFLSGLLIFSIVTGGCQYFKITPKGTTSEKKGGTGLKQNCAECHQDLDAATRNSKELIFSHDVHEKAGANCTDCHSERVHTTDKTIIPTMQTCYKCHGFSKKAKATGECAACHPAGFNLKPKDHLVSNFLPPIHAERAQKDKSYCDMCHKSSFCMNCHGMEMPHPAGFKGKHAEQAKKGISSCTMCHKDRSSCTACHHKGSKPNVSWLSQHPEIVKQKGANACFECHDPRYCAHCHVTGQKYPNIKGP